eukprot:TRINITY_DN16356_c0_g2_i2.p1 TRINITY_DN16356_c0_g2~~TRINITY_DN16356_c0_g2_i2.p1  ORF type:complete len:413 (+),score=102.58 TRINITY_DN16356_c0_g2_i2:241-1479(+)
MKRKRAAKVKRQEDAAAKEAPASVEATIDGGNASDSSARAKVRSGAFCIKSSLNVPFLLVSDRALVRGHQAPNAEEWHEILALCGEIVKQWDTRCAAVLADFEGELMGFEGELLTATFQRTFAVDPKSMRTMPSNETCREMGFLVDMRCSEGVELVRRVMESEAVAKLIWGADGDLTSLRYTPARAPLAIQPTRVVDVQLAYSTPERRLGMAKMLARLPEESIAGLPAKNSIDFNSAHSQNRRALALPLNADFAAYAVDDIHRLDAVLRHQRPAGGSYSQAQSQTASLLALLLRNPASVASAKLKQYAGNLNRKWGIERLLVAVRVKRHLGCCSRVLESADAESLRAQFAKLEEEVDQILLDETVQIPEDLAFGPPLGEAEEKGAEEEAPEEEEASAKKLKRAAKRRKKMAH